MVRRYDRDDGVDVVADFGRAADVSVDLVDGTAILVVEREESVQRELELPDGEAKAFINNGVVTIEVKR